MLEAVQVKKIKKEIIKVIVFFDMFDYPVTEFELWRFLGVKCSLRKIMEVMSDKEFLRKHDIEKKNSFYFFASRSYIIETRNARYNYTDRKFKIAIRVAKLFRFIPWIKMISIGNIVGSNNLDNNGDIDFFIITEKNRVWISRLFCACLMAMFRMRPSPGNEKDKVCLSFFIDTEMVDLEKIKFSKDDIYFNYWIAGVKPIYDKDQTYLEFIKKNNWIKDVFPNWQEAKSVYFRDVKSRSSKFYDDIVDLLFGGLNYKLQNWQIKMMPDILKKMMNKDTRVIIKERILKLHVNDRRDKIKERFIRRLNLRLK